MSVRGTGVVTGLDFLLQSEPPSSISHSRKSLRLRPQTESDEEEFVTDTNPVSVADFLKDTDPDKVLPAFRISSFCHFPSYISFSLS